MTPIVVFLPLIAITGVTGVFFRALAITVGVALLTSLGLALTWTPTLSHFFIRSKAAHARGASRRIRKRLGDCSASAGADVRQAFCERRWRIPSCSRF